MSQLLRKSSHESNSVDLHLSDLFLNYKKFPADNLPQPIEEAKQSILKVFETFLKAIEIEMKQNDEIFEMIKKERFGEAQDHEMNILKQKNEDLKMKLQNSLKNELVNKTSLELAFQELEKLKLKEIDLLNSKNLLKNKNERLQKHKIRLEIEIAYSKQFDNQISEPLKLIEPSPAPSLASSNIIDNKEIEFIKQQLDETRLLSELRLKEIETLRNEKIDLIKKNESNEQKLQIDIKESDIEKSSTFKHLIDEKRILETDNKRQAEKINLLLSEIDSIRDMHQKNINQVKSEFKKQSSYLQGKIEKMTQNQKKIEYEREKIKQRLALSEAKINYPQSFEHFNIMKDHLELYKTSNESLKNDLEKLKNELKNLTSNQSNFSISNYVNSFGSNELDQDKKLLKEAQETLFKQQKEIEGLGQAIEDLVSANASSQAETDSLILEIDKRDQRIEALIKEKVNIISSSSNVKKQSAMESELIRSLKDELAQITKLLDNEKSNSVSLKNDIGQLQKEMISLRNLHENQTTISIQSSILIDFLQKKIVELENEIELKKDLISQIQTSFESEKGLRARVDEQLNVSQRQLTLKSSTSSFNGDSDSRLKKDLNLYQTIFNCTLCERARRVDSVISICGHVFCGVCIKEKCIKPRNRKCPKCKQTFGEGDILELYF